MGFAKLLTPLIQHVPSGSKRRESTPTPSADRPSSIATPATSSFPRSAPTEVSSLNSEVSQQAPGVAAIVQTRGNSATFALLPLPRYVQESAHRTPRRQRGGRPLRPADALTRQLEGRCAGVTIAYLEIMAARRSRQQLAQWVSADCFHRLLPRFPKNPRQVPQDQILTRPPAILRVRAQRVNPSLYEAVVLLQCGQHIRVVTLQVRQIHGTWLVTSLDQPNP